MKLIGYCSKCNGTGIIPVGQSTAPCNRCSGDGQIDIGLIESTENDILADILNYCAWMKEKLETISEKIK